MEQQNGSLWADTLKKEVIEYTVNRKRDKEMTTVLENVRTVLEDIIQRVDTDNSLKNFSKPEIIYLKDTSLDRDWET